MCVCVCCTVAAGQTCHLWMKWTTEKDAIKGRDGGFDPWSTWVCLWTGSFKKRAQNTGRTHAMTPTSSSLHQCLDETRREEKNVFYALKKVTHFYGRLTGRKNENYWSWEVTERLSGEKQRVTSTNAEDVWGSTAMRVYGRVEKYMLERCGWHDLTGYSEPTSPK